MVQMLLTSPIPIRKDIAQGEPLLAVPRAWLPWFIVAPQSLLVQVPFYGRVANSSIDIFQGKGTLGDAANIAVAAAPYVVKYTIKAMDITALKATVRSDLTYEAEGIRGADLEPFKVDYPGGGGQYLAPIGRLAQFSRNYLNRRRLVVVYRGTSMTAEREAFNQTGHILSESAKNAYFDTDNIVSAYKEAAATHTKWIRLWGSESDYVLAHGHWGQELPKSLGMDRTLISLTTDPEQAFFFANYYQPGEVFYGIVPESSILWQTLETSGENEALIRLGSNNFFKLVLPSK